MSFMCCSSMIGTAFDLCIVPMPLTKDPVYRFGSGLAVDAAVEVLLLYSGVSRR